MSVSERDAPHLIGKSGGVSCSGQGPGSIRRHLLNTLRFRAAGAPGDRARGRRVVSRAPIERRRPAAPHARRARGEDQGVARRLGGSRPERGRQGVEFGSRVSCAVLLPIFSRGLLDQQQARVLFHERRVCAKDRGYFGFAFGSHSIAPFADASLYSRAKTRRDLIALSNFGENCARKRPLRTRPDASQRPVNCLPSTLPRYTVHGSELAVQVGGPHKEKAAEVRNPGGVRRTTR